MLCAKQTWWWRADFRTGLRCSRRGRAAHPHLVCERCGKISHPEASPEVNRRLLAAFAAGTTSFEVRELHVVAKGICAGCLGRKEVEPPAGA